MTYLSRLVYALAYHASDPLKVVTSQTVNHGMFLSSLELAETGYTVVQTNLISFDGLGLASISHRRTNARDAREPSRLRLNRSHALCYSSKMIVVSLVEVYRILQVDHDG